MKFQGLKQLFQSLFNRWNINTVNRSIGDQQFVGLDGQTLTYAGAAPSSSTWITSIMKQSRGGKKRSIMSGEVSVLGNLENIVKSLHRAMRYPLLVRRYTNRLYQ